MAVTPTRPSSSPSAVKMKSVEAAAGHREQPLDELEALAVVVGPGVAPGLDPDLEVAEELVGDERAQQEQHQAGGHVGEAPGRPGRSPWPEAPCALRGRRPGTPPGRSWRPRTAGPRRGRS